MIRKWIPILDPSMKLLKRIQNITILQYLLIKSFPPNKTSVRYKILNIRLY